MISFLKENNVLRRSTILPYLVQIKKVTQRGMTEVEKRGYKYLIRGLSLTRGRAEYEKTLTFSHGKFPRPRTCKVITSPFPTEESNQLITYPRTRFINLVD